MSVWDLSEHAKRKHKKAIISQQQKVAINWWHTSNKQPVAK